MTTDQPSVLAAPVTPQRWQELRPHHIATVVAGIVALLSPFTLLLAVLPR